MYLVDHFILVLLPQTIKNVHQEKKHGLLHKRDLIWDKPTGELTGQFRVGWVSPEGILLRVRFSEDIEANH